MNNLRVPKEWLGAFKKGHRQNSREFIDDEFAYELLKKAEGGCVESALALAWLTKFNNEFHKHVMGDEPLHNTEELRLDCSRRNDSRKRDIYSQVLLFRPLAIEYEPDCGTAVSEKARQDAFEIEKSLKRRCF